MALVLLVASQAEHRRYLLPTLQAIGHLTVLAETVETGVRTAVDHAPDVIVLATSASEDEAPRDLVLLCSRIDASHTPVIVAMPAPADAARVLAYELGAKDVVAIPVSERELAFRLECVVGRPSPVTAASSILIYGALRVDVDARRVWVATEERALTALEFDLLTAVLLASGRVMSRPQLLLQVWRRRFAGETRTVDTHVKRLRQKLGAAGEYIETVRGIGYRLEGAVQREVRPNAASGPGWSAREST